MLFRNRAAASPEPQPAPESEASSAQADIARAGGKGRPTPKRSQAEAARRRPLVPADRKAAAKAQREAARAARDRQYQAMQSGDEKALPARDKGPVRRWIRDYVDARWNLGEFLLPVALVMAFATFFTTRSPELTNLIVTSTLVVGLLSFLDAFFLAQLLKRSIRRQFGEVPRGSAGYGVMRAFQMRRTRLPRPQVSRGEWPR